LDIKQWKMLILSCIWGPLLVIQIILVLVLGIFNETGFDEVMYLGWLIWAISVIFGFLPIFTFRRRGDVAKGKSYVHTKTLVTTGVYSLLRHPQYTAGILFSLALTLMAQSWLVLSLGIILIPLLYMDIVMADKHELEKFGDDYRHYMEKVPRSNFLLGAIRLLVWRKGENHS